MSDEFEPIDPDRIVMQPRCVYCLREQWAIIVALVSKAEAGCAWCGRIPPIFTDEGRYRAAMHDRRET